MATTIMEPDNSMWAGAIKSLHEKGDITSEQMELCLNRLHKQDIGVELSSKSVFKSELNMFICPICNQNKFVWERDNTKRNWCRNCADELIGDMM